MEKQLIFENMLETEDQLLERIQNAFTPTSNTAWNIGHGSTNRGVRKEVLNIRYNCHNN